MSTQLWLFSETVLTPAQLAAVGAVVIEATLAETMLESVIWDLLGIKEDRGRYVTQDLMASKRLEMFKRLARLHVTDADYLAELDARTATFAAAFDDRNLIVHGNWETQVSNFWALLRDGADKHPPAVAVKRARKSETVKQFSADRVLDVAHRLADHRRWLLSFSAECWPEKWREVRSADGQ